MIKIERIYYIRKAKEGDVKKLQHIIG